MANAETLAKALSMEGQLKKKSPNALIGYQKRYFAVRDDGKLLAYYRKKPVANKQKEAEDPLDSFVLAITGRDFELKADNGEQKDTWIRALAQLQERLKETSPSPNRKNKSKTKSWKVGNVDAGVLDVVRSGTVAESRAAPSFNAEDVHQQVMVAKGIWQFLGNLPRKVLRARLRCGFLNKRSKGTIKFFRRRWFILFTPTPFVPNADDDVYVPETQLPNWMRHNHIYYFNFAEEDDTSEALGEIPTRLCTIRVKDMSKSKDPGFSFYVDVGNRKFHLNTEDESEMNKWIEAIEASKRIAQGIQSSVTGKPRNLTVSIELFDNHGPSALKGKINDTIKGLTANALKDQSDINELLTVGDGLTKELVETIDGCLTSTPQRIDIATLYAETFHKKLSEIFARAWNTHGPKMPQTDLLTLAKWIDAYDAQLRQVGITDDKLKKGVNVLRKTYTTRMYRAAASQITNALIGLKDLVISEEGFCTTDLPEVTFSSFESVFSDPYLKTEQSFRGELLEAVWSFILQTLNALQALLERRDAFALEVLVALCNDCLVLDEKVARFYEEISEFKFPELNEESRELLHEISKSYSKAVAGCLMFPAKASFSRPFHELSLENEFESLQSRFGVWEPRLSRTLLPRVWQDILVKTIALYTDCILSGGTGLKAQSVCSSQMLLVTETVKSDLRLTQRVLAKKLDRGLIEEQLQGLCDLVDFLEALPDEIARSCLALRRSLGPDFKVNIAKTLIENRSDLEPAEKKAAIEHARKVLENYIEETPTVNKQRTLPTRQRLTSSDGSKKEESTHDEEETKSPNRSFKAADPTIYLLDVSGYLQKKMSSSIGYHQRFFSMKNGRLYWYKNEKSYSAQGSLGLDTLQSLEVLDADSCSFRVVFQGRDLELQAENARDMDAWVQAFNKILAPQSSAKLTTVFTDTSESSLFEDIEEPERLSDRHAIAAKVLLAIPKAPKRKKPEKPLPQYPTSAPESPYRPASIGAKTEVEAEVTHCCFCFPVRRAPEAKQPLLQ